MDCIRPRDHALASFKRHVSAFPFTQCRKLGQKLSTRFHPIERSCHSLRLH